MPIQQKLHPPVLHFSDFVGCVFFFEKKIVYKLNRIRSKFNKKKLQHKSGFYFSLGPALNDMDRQKLKVFEQRVYECVRREFQAKNKDVYDNR